MTKEQSAHELLLLNNIEALASGEDNNLDKADYYCYGRGNIAVSYTHLNFLLFLLCRLTDLYYICWKESFNKENMQLIDGKAISEHLDNDMAQEVIDNHLLFYLDDHTSVSYTHL